MFLNSIFSICTSDQLATVINGRGRETSLLCTWNWKLHEIQKHFLWYLIHLKDCASQVGSWKSKQLKVETQIYPHLLGHLNTSKDAFQETLVIYLSRKLYVSITYISALCSCQDVFYARKHRFHEQGTLFSHNAGFKFSREKNGLASARCILEPSL